MSTKITLENNYGKFVVETFDEDLSYTELIDQLIKPVSLAAGYSPKTVEKFLN